jgi:hypothetical protein
VIASGVLVTARALPILPVLSIAACLADADPVDSGGSEAGSGGSEAGSGAATETPEDALVVFVTSRVVAGDFGGTEAADAICLERATAASLPGSYRAWLSTMGVTAASRIGDTERPYVLTDFTTVVANGTADIYDGFLEHAIDLDEHADAPPTTVATCASIEGPAVWTGSSDIGDWSGNDCVGWTAPVGDGGTIGVIAPGQLDVTWTNGCTVLCEQTASLYCFQLP